MSIYYAGVGSRKTVEDILKFMENLGEKFARLGFVLRSGGAEGADTAFEVGCDRACGQKEIFLPWKKFNKNLSSLCKPTKEAFELASQTHPVWDTLSYGSKCLHARNCHQILGTDLKSPVAFTVYWSAVEDQGGTQQAVRLSRKYDIPCFNLFVDRDYKLIKLISEVFCK